MLAAVLVVKKIRFPWRLMCLFLLTLLVSSSATAGAPYKGSLTDLFDRPVYDDKGKAGEDASLPARSVIS